MHPKIDCHANICNINDDGNNFRIDNSNYIKDDRNDNHNNIYNILLHIRTMLHYKYLTSI